MFASFHINCASVVAYWFGSQNGVLSNFHFIILQNHRFIIAESFIPLSGEISCVYQLCLPPHPHQLHGCKGRQNLRLIKLQSCVYKWDLSKVSLVGIVQEGVTYGSSAELLIIRNAPCHSKMWTSRPREMNDSCIAAHHGGFHTHSVTIFMALVIFTS